MYKYSNVLGQAISDKTALEIERISNYIPHPIEIKELPKDNASGFGAADYFSDDVWTVYTRTDLPKIFFEANILHELYHLCQVIECFPTTQTLTRTNLSTKDKKYLELLGASAVSLILDLDVCDRITEAGLSSGYFFDSRYKQMMSYKFNENDFDFRDNVIMVTIMIAKIILENPEIQARNIIQHYKSINPIVTSRGQRLASKIEKLNHSTPIGCFECLTKLFDYLKIWDLQRINFQGQIFDCGKDADNFLQCFRQKS